MAVAGSATVLTLGQGEQEALTALANMSQGSATSRAWRAAIGAMRGGADVPKRTFHNWVQRLIEKGCVEKDPVDITTASRRWVPVPLACHWHAMRRAQ